MSGEQPSRPGPARAPAPPKARVRRMRFSLVWIIPVVALAIALYLGVRSLHDEGPTITITFKTGSGLVAGQTKVQHKAVNLGQVESVSLSKDLQTVIVRVRMRREAERYLTDKARFWVVRPRLSSGSISGFETLLSGSYIEMDPGVPDAKEQRDYVGLEQPPGVRSGEPGRTYALKAVRIGSLGPGAPVFYRDITVGEVLGYDIGDGTGPVTVRIFVKKPYDDFIRKGTHFWNASGLSVQVGSDGLHVEVASLQAVLSGGVAFDSPHDPKSAPVLPADTDFKLYRNYDEAQAAGYTQNLEFVSYFTTSVRGLTKGSPVEFFGLQIGDVTDVKLDLPPDASRARVRVQFQVQPQRIDDDGQAATGNPLEVTRRLVARGLRAQLSTASYITGSMVLALDFVPSAPKAVVTMDNGIPVIPSVGGGLGNILSSVSDIASKFDRLPLDEIGANLNGTLRSASGAMASIEGLAQKTDRGLTPLLSRLPAIVKSLQDAVVNADRTFGSLNRGYGSNSQFNRELERAMVQVGDTARSIRILADFLDRHPEALVRGRAGVGNN